jgi:DNA-binding MarR family transcriptional regulator
MAKGKTRIAREGLNASVTHLLHRTLQLALDYHAEAGGPAAPTQRQFTVLSAVAAAEGLTQNDLVRATGIDRSTLADLVNRLTDRGLLERARSATDARANTVSLSPTGRLALLEGAAAAAAADARLLALLSPKKRETFLKTLTSLAEIADEPGGPGGAKKAGAAEKGEAGAEKKKKKVKKAAKAARPPKPAKDEGAEAEAAA